MSAVTVAGPVVAATGDVMTSLTEQEQCRPGRRDTRTLAHSQDLPFPISDGPPDVHAHDRR